MKNFLSSFVNTNSVAFPNTAAVNSSGGGATDGTEFVKIFVDDWWGFAQDLLNFTDDTPNGNSEVGASQLLESLIKMISNQTELTSNETHTVEEFDKRSILVLSSGCTIARLVGGTGADETNRLLVQNNNTVTVEVDFGANVNEEEIIIQPGQWIEFVYDSEDLKFVFLKSNKEIVVTITTNYTIGDWLPSGTKILVNHSASTGLITVTAPTLADNKAKVFEVKNIGNGLTYIAGEGAEKLSFKGTEIANFKLYLNGDYGKIQGQTSNWKIMRCYSHIESGWYNRSDWTDVHIGLSNFVYDNGSGTSTKSASWTGQKITEATSGNTGIILSDSSAGVTGTFTVYFVTGTGIFTDGRVITAGNGETIDVNEGTTNKNDDNNIAHNMAINQNDYILRLWVGTTGVWSAAYEFSYSMGEDGGTFLGMQFSPVDTNNIKIQSAASGIDLLLDNGTRNALNTDDYYTYISIVFSI